MLEAEQPVVEHLVIKRLWLIKDRLQLTAPKRHSLRMAQSHQNSQEGSLLFMLLSVEWINLQ